MSNFGTSRDPTVEPPDTWNRPPVLYPSILDQLEMPDAFHVQYRLADGCFMFNGRLFEWLEAGIDIKPPKKTSLDPQKLFMANRERVTPAYLGPNISMDLTLTESFSSLKTWLRTNTDNCIQNHNLTRVCQGYQSKVRYTSPCNDPHSIPLEKSLARHVVIPTEIFGKPNANLSKILFYMTHNNRQMQLLCNGNSNSFFDVPMTRNGGRDYILYMQDYCLSFAVKQALNGDI